MCWPTTTKNPQIKMHQDFLSEFYMQATDNAQGYHELLHLQTNSVITHNCVTPALIKPTIINKVNYIADREGIPSGIKISNIKGLVSYDSAYITGVDYSENDDDKNEF